MVSQKIGFVQINSKRKKEIRRKFYRKQKLNICGRTKVFVTNILEQRKLQNASIVNDF